MERWRIRRRVWNSEEMKDAAWGSEELEEYKAR